MVKLTFVGDIFPADEIFTNGFGIKSKTTDSNIDRWKKNISEVVGAADYIIGNLESPLIDDKDAKGKTFYGRPIFAEVLKESGINVLNIANNHIAEHGVEGFNNTVATLLNKGIQIIGGIKDGYPDILSIRHDGTTICISSFCDESISSIKNQNCYACLTEENVMDTLGRMKSIHPDVCIFIFHWGNEYIHYPSPNQRKLAKKLIDEGADLIVGHHPHVIQPYEYYHGSHIIYSLGNFCFDDVQSNHFGKGMIANVIIQNKSITNISFSGLLVQDMAYSNNLVKPMGACDFERYYLQIISNYSQVNQLSEKLYSNIYIKKLKREHQKERINMRLNLIKKIFDIRHQHKAKLIKNITNFIFKIK